MASVEKMFKSRAEFLSLIESDCKSESSMHVMLLLTPNYLVCQIPPVKWTLPLDRIDTTTLSNEDADTLSEPVNAPDLSPRGGGLPSSKKRSFVKKLFSGLRNKRRSCNSESYA